MKADKTSSTGSTATRPKRSGRVITLLASIAASLLLLVTASSASAMQVGLNWSGIFPTTQSQWDVIGHSGANQFRLNASWAEVSGHGNWRESGAWEQTYDKYFEMAARSGVTILPDLYGRRNGEPVHQFYLPEESTNWKEWNEFVWTFVQRYGRGGTFWKAHTGLPYKPALDWEVWNEPNLPENNPGEKVLPQKYGEFLVSTSNTIRNAQNAVRPGGEPNDTKVLLGGLYQPGGTAPWQFLEGASKASGFAASFDGLAVHPYGLNGNESEKIATVAINLDNARAALDKWAGSSKSLWITELGWPVYNSYHGNNPTGATLVTEQEQANLLTYVFNWLKEKAGYYNLEMAVWYNVNDVDNAAWQYHCGLRDEAGNYRKSWYAFLKQTGAAPTYFSAFQANTGLLYTHSSDTGAASLGAGMATGTSPSVARLTNGSYVIAFQANTGYLYTYSTATGEMKNTGIGMATGTSPSVTGLTNGSYEVAVQINTGYLETYSPSAGAAYIGIGMAKGTSPSITGLTNGSYEVAVQINTGSMETYSPTAGALNTGIGMATGTSPSITGLTNGSYEVAVQINTGYLETYSPTAGAAYLGIGMATGTSPSITGLANGSYVIAVQINTGYLETYSSTAGPTYLGIGMAKGTSPSIAALSNGSYVISMQINTGYLETYSPFEAKFTGAGMAEKSSPATAGDGF